jgi:predicted ATPase
MKKLRVTLKNYRAFTDEDPLRIEIGPGFTAIVGKNNSGKSAAKLFFYEFRQLFKALSKPIGSSPSLGSIVGSGQTVVDYLGVTDVEEVFCNSNSRPATIEFEIAEAASYRLGADCLTRVTASCDRSNRNWSFAAFGKEAPNTNLLNAQKTPRGTAGENILLFGNDTLDCTEFRQVFKCLGEAKYYGPFRNAINQGAGEHYDLRVGTSFIDLWREWKTSGVKQKSRAIDQVTEEIRRLFEFDRLEISASDQLKTLIVSVNGQPHLLSELGSGLAQFIMVLGNAATSPPTILFIDEPETNLHPALQIDFLLSLARYASEGVVFLLIQLDWRGRLPKQFIRRNEKEPRQFLGHSRRPQITWSL